ncbi:hypothetical protein D5S18_34135 [Nocardia panacis]|uniref:Uncharacterized protein n=1 Tax=Nocardia panacis TaxID=2340916 RepID=A0A3A4K566_9NOCA|nr:hypothetical protein [Nocardia panacis]RJO67942.1 hypothetical protein D5S18_34135 [Nocardia panacis]
MTAGQVLVAFGLVVLLAGLMVPVLGSDCSTGVDHPAPAGGFTIAGAHCATQQHLRCSPVECECVREAWRTLILAGRCEPTPELHRMLYG